jgi:hypothetical protein
MIRKETIEHILESFGLHPANFDVVPHGNGLIHQTYVVKENLIPKYILQRVNDAVFHNPEDIALNLRYIGNFLHNNNPEFLFTLPLCTIANKNYAYVDSNFYRIFHYVKDSHTISTCETADQAYEAAKAFGSFTNELSGLQLENLKFTIPQFHDLNYRFDSFENALETGNNQRIVASKDLIDWLFLHENVVKYFNTVLKNNAFKKRVTHHDTKISNVLFDSFNKSICVIDLDTVMPGYFISDVGDMIRTYTSEADEEEKDLDKIYFRKNFFEAIKAGYLENMNCLLSSAELDSFAYAGKFMIYMQALRFFTDYINDDCYYGAKYPTHNLVRAKNQMRLFDLLIKEYP